jgi:hypothetical protein
MSATIGTVTSGMIFFSAAGGLLVRAGDPHDVGARHLEGTHLVDGPLDVGGPRVGHGLDGDRRVAAHRHLADVDLARPAPKDVAIGANAHALPFQNPPNRRPNVLARAAGTPPSGYVRDLQTTAKPFPQAAGDVPAGIRAQDAPKRRKLQG